MRLGLPFSGSPSPFFRYSYSYPVPIHFTITNYLRMSTQQTYILRFFEIYIAIYVIYVYVFIKSENKAGSSYLNLPEEPQPSIFARFL